MIDTHEKWKIFSKTQIEPLEMKSIMFEIKNILNRNHDKLDLVAEKIEDIVTKIIQRKKERKVK